MFVGFIGVDGRVLECLLAKWCARVWAKLFLSLAPCVAAFYGQVELASPWVKLI
jgi:hypothetical protein